MSMNAPNATTTAKTSNFTQKLNIATKTVMNSPQLSNSLKMVLENAMTVEIIVTFANPVKFASSVKRTVKLNISNTKAHVSTNAQSLSMEMLKHQIAKPNSLLLLANHVEKELKLVKLMSKFKKLKPQNVFQVISYTQALASFHALMDSLKGNSQSIIQMN